MKNLEQLINQIEDKEIINTVEFPLITMEIVEVQRLLTAIKLNGTITSLNLWANYIEKDGVKLIIEALPSLSITAIAIYGNQIGSIGAGFLAEALMTQESSITFVRLWSNDIGNLGAKLLSQALMQSGCKIKCMDLSYNRIGDSGADYIAAALVTNSSMELIDLSGNFISNFGALAIAKAIPYNNSLISLNLRDNKITVIGSEPFTIALHKNTTLTSLILDFFNSGNIFRKIMVFNKLADLDKQDIAHESTIEVFSTFIMQDWYEALEYYFSDLDLSVRNKKGETLFSRFFNKLAIDKVPKILEVLWPVIEQQNIEVDQSLAGNAGTILHKLAYDGAWETIIWCITKAKDSGELWFNVNKLDINGDRLMDLSVKAENYDLIEILRAYGSVEPKGGFGIIERIDIDGINLDTPDNIINALKILSKLYYNFPLASETEIDDQINWLREQDFGDLCNDQWSSNQSLTIVQIIDKLSAMRAENDRELDLDFKQALAHVIYVVRSSNDYSLLDALINCLSVLNMCPLGKLIMLVSVVQDKILERSSIDYSVMKFSDFAGVLSLVTEQAEAMFGEQIRKAVSRWFYDLYYNAIKPENWHYYTLQLQGLFNEQFLDLNPAWDKIASYHFKQLRAILIDPLLMKMDSGCSNDSYDLQLWHSWKEAGLIIIAEEFYKKALSATTKQQLQELLNAFASPEYAFGEFTPYLPPAPIAELLHTYNKMQSHETKDLFLTLLEQFFPLEYGARDFIIAKHFDQLLGQFFELPLSDESISI
ncbi:Leucine-rich repeats-containing protein [Candidatus Trichorickettsia mobilis]|uniref:Leucine-rich repeats-containing protein n=1 Tax=Candidatus Trichorickettsia mobilis TaxID=1346319 RepID=A0ABZ0US88_9RICK|nr:hypothetical protein [Candidatus Trichorickettsia mobilis]WPY00890.1 Leucine-rich repeats-containing protein [Candidatus Trichorickettsia mobilis]